MEYTELADYPVPSGRITEWIPAVDTDRWQTDDRPLSPNHAAHLINSLNQHSSPSSEATDDVGLGSWIGTAFRLPGTFDRSVFAEVVRTWIVRHDAFRTTASFQGDSHTRFVVVPESVTVTVRDHGAPPAGVGVDLHLERFFAREVSATRWPHVVAVTIEPDSRVEAAKGVRVIVAADHSVMDAYTQLMLIAEFREIYAALLDNRPPALPPCGSYVDHCAYEYRAAAAVTAEDPAVEAWRTFLTSGSGRPEMPRLPLPTQVSPSEPDTTGWQSSLSLWLLGAAEATAFTSACKAHGSSLSTGAYTAFAVAIARLTGERTTRFVMPMHTRTDPESLAAAGWYVGLAPVEMSLGDATTFGEALQSINSGVRRHYALAHKPYPRIASLLGTDEAPRFAVSYVDTRHVPGADAWGGRDRVLRSRVHNLDEVYVWINRTTAGINISLRFPNNEVATASIHALVAEFGAVLRQVAENGGLALTSPDHEQHSRSSAERA